MEHLRSIASTIFVFKVLRRCWVNQKAEGHRLLMNRVVAAATLTAPAEGKAPDGSATRRQGAAWGGGAGAFRVETRNKEDVRNPSLLLRVFPGWTARTRARGFQAVGMET